MLKVQFVRIRQILFWRKQLIDVLLNIFICVLCIKHSGFAPPKLECQSELGMKSGQIPNSAITASSSLNQYYGPERARLDTIKSGSYAGAWIPKYQDLGQWIGVDLGKITKITRIATQGRQDASHWTKSYSLTYSVEGGPFLLYNNKQVKYFAKGSTYLSHIYLTGINWTSLSINGKSTYQAVRLIRYRSMRHRHCKVHHLFEFRSWLK